MSVTPGKRRECSQALSLDPLVNGLQKSCHNASHLFFMTCLHLQNIALPTDRECSKDTRRSLVSVCSRCTQCHALFPPPVMKKDSFQYPLSKKSGYFISCGKTPFPSVAGTL